MNFSYDDDLILENQIVLLRPIKATDIALLLPVAIKDKGLLQYSPSPIYDEALLDAYIANALSYRKEKARYTFVVYSKKDNAYVGSTSLLNISPSNCRLEIGATWYGKEFQRTGINRNCKFLLLEYAFDILGAERVEFKTDERNLASRKAIERIGGQFEGILRRHTLMHDGFMRNTVCYSILINEWKTLKDNFL